MTDAKLRVFLCHASQDRPVVQELYQRFLVEGWIDPWLDVKNILPGQDWRVAIEEAVESADSVIICLSTNSVKKEGYIQKEMRYAQEISLEKPEGTIYLIPVRLNDCDIPRGLRFFQWTDYFGVNKEQNCTKLLAALEERFKERANEKANQELEARVKQDVRKEIDDIFKQESKEDISQQITEKWNRLDNLSEKVVRDPSIGLKSLMLFMYENPEFSDFRRILYSIYNPTEEDRTLYLGIPDGYMVVKLLELIESMKKHLASFKKKP